MTTKKKKDETRVVVEVLEPLRTAYGVTHGTPGEMEEEHAKSLQKQGVVKILTEKQAEKALAAEDAKA